MAKVTMPSIGCVPEEFRIRHDDGAMRVGLDSGFCSHVIGGQLHSFAATGRKLHIKI
jgi:hypothetical protein